MSSDSIPENALPPITVSEHSVEIAEHPAAALNVLAQVAERWGGAWQAEEGHQGRLGIPVSAGIRQGWVAGPVSAQAVDGNFEACRLVFRAEVGQYMVNRGAVVVLLIAGLAGSMALLAPFFPRLWPLVPLGFVLGLAAWLMVIARLRNSGPEEFLQSVLEQAESEASANDS